MYVGGQEHATGHLLYSRFWTNFLYDIGKLSFKEPFKKMKNQGMILGSDSRKMSKRWGNVVNPDDIVNTYGADTLRVYEMFMGPFDQMLPWSTESIIGSRRFLERVWRAGEGVSEDKRNKNKTEEHLEKLLHKTIKKVTEDIESFNFNTAISSMMILVNEMEKAEISILDFKLFLIILSPFAPHITEEIWANLGEKGSITKSTWPKWDEEKIVEQDVIIVIQINGKVRTEIKISKDSSEEKIKTVALSDEVVKKWVEGKEVKRFIVIPNKLINIVI
jgi:leucyl-tRNA synthetase